MERPPFEALASDFRAALPPDGSTGIALAKTFNPVFILLDIPLPMREGGGVPKELRKLSPTRNVPVIAATFCAVPGGREKTLAAGCSGSLEQPINSDPFAMGRERFLPPNQKGKHYDSYPDSR